MGRSLRTRLDLLRPRVGERVQVQQEKQKQYYNQHANKRELVTGQHVWVRNFRDGPRWVKGVITESCGSLTYIIRTQDGLSWKRHLNHIRGSSNDLKCETEDTIDYNLQSMSLAPSSTVTQKKLMLLPSTCKHLSHHLRTILRPLTRLIQNAIVIQRGIVNHRIDFMER